ncbi:MAG: hypothetical protein ACFNJI_00240 [Leptotrichia hongkongensis]
MSIFLIMLGYFMTALIVFEIIKHYLKKYINERIDESLKFLDKLENINDELDTKIDSVKIKTYNMYLDRCKESLRKKREMDKEIREMAQKIKDKISKK